VATIVHRSLGVEQGVETPWPDSPWVVMKFGGRSVATAQNWERIAALIRARLDEGVTPVVVHSALAGVSNALIDLLDTAERGDATGNKLEAIRGQHDALAADLEVDAALLDELFEKLEQLIAGVRLVGEVSPRVHARVLATGALAATRPGAAYLARIGLPAVWQDARTLLQSSSARDLTERSQFLSARCDYSPSEPLQRQLAGIDGFVLTQGFIARNTQRQTVLLGRGGSDTS